MEPPSRLHRKSTERKLRQIAGNNSIVHRERLVFTRSFAGGMADYLRCVAPCPRDNVMGRQANVDGAS